MLVCKSILLGMKSQLFESIWFRSVVCLAVWAGVSCARAQTLLGLNAQIYAGLTITGAVGTRFEVQYVNDLAQTNNWLHLTNITLPSNPYLYFDPTSAGSPRRFYRAVLLPSNMITISAGPFTMGD